MFFQTKWLKKQKRSQNYIYNKKFHERIKNVGGIITIAVVTGATILELKSIGNDAN